MPTHRLDSSFRRDLHLLRPSSLRRLSTMDIVWPGIFFTLFGVLLPVAWLTTGNYQLTIAFALIGLFGLSVDLVMAGRRRRWDLAQNEREGDLLDLMARVPQGAPMVAQHVEHCGCLTRWLWTGQYWRQTGVVSAATDCARGTVSVDHG